MKNTLLILLLFTISITSQAQVIGDALRYANTEVTGTARTLGIGGAIGAIGTDFSAMSKNPAGLAWYRKSEFVFTPSLDLRQVTSTLGDTKRNRSTYRFDLDNVGLVFKGRKRKGSLRSLNFAMGYNSIANFYQDYQFAGDTPGSITDRFLELTSDGNENTPNLVPDQLDDFEAGLAYEAGALLSNQSEGNYFYSTDFTSGEIVEKSQVNVVTGGINEFTISLAGNIEEKLLVGATIGVPVVNYQETKSYREKDEDNQNPLFESLEFNEYLNQTGSGINAKLGIIYRPVHMMRVGLALHTPTTYNLKDNFSTKLTYSYLHNNAIQSTTADSPEGSFDYKVKTPTVVTGSTAFIIDKVGLISAEVEWKDYSATKFNFNNTTSDKDLTYEAELNEQIQNSYKSALTVRLGGEFAYNKIRIRAGYGLIGSPYVTGDKFNSSVSAGIGIRERVFYADLGYRSATSGETYFPYVTFDKEANPQQEVSNSIKSNTFLFTVGFRF